MADTFAPGDHVTHTAFPDVVGAVVEATLDVPHVKVTWPDGAPVELTSTEWHPAGNLAHAYPVCDNCGERHPVADLAAAIDLIKNVVVMEASAVAAALPGQFPRLERALAQGAAVWREIQVQKFAAALSEAPETEEPQR